MISESYKHVLRKEHDHDPSWGSRGYVWAYVAAGIALLEDCHEVLDYGCGKGSLAATMRRTGAFHVREYDPGIRGKDGYQLPADLVVCTDVLEHVEPECIDRTLREIRKLTKKLLFAVISTRPAGHILHDGRNAHFIVQPNDWWLKMLHAHKFSIRRDWKTMEQQLVVMAE